MTMNRITRKVFFATLFAVLMVLVTVASSQIALTNVSPNNNAGQVIFHPLSVPNEMSSASSLNWAGYVVTGGSHSVTSVTASFLVPSVNASGKSTYVALWAGMDGYNSNTVEQAGILAESSHGSVVYSAWTEFYPAAPTYASWAPLPGDTITVTVTATLSASSVPTVTAVVSDISHSGESYTQSSSSSTYTLSSAEWIVERPAVAGSLTTLADYGIAEFGKSFTSVSNTDFATIGGVTGSIGSFSNSVGVTMVQHNGSVLASPSALSGNGSSFTVTNGTSSSSSGGSGGGNGGGHGGGHGKK